MEKFTVLNLLNLNLKEHNNLALQCITGREGLLTPIKESDFNRPGLALSGFFYKFGSQRIQIFGRGEHAYLQDMYKRGTTAAITKFFRCEIPCCIFTHNLKPTKDFIQASRATTTPILQTSLSTNEFTIRLMRALGNVFAARKIIHGTLVEVFGIGVLLLGESGVGKSETALELIERGHRLVADDVVEIRRIAGNILLGQGKTITHTMEIRGLGIIDVSELFGVGSIRDNKQIQLICHLEDWNADKHYDRLGKQENTYEILGVGCHYLEIPVKPGRNIPIIIETAAMNERHKKIHYYVADNTTSSTLEWLRSARGRRVYANSEDNGVIHRRHYV